MVVYKKHSQQKKKQGCRHYWMKRVFYIRKPSFCKIGDEEPVPPVELKLGPSIPRKEEKTTVNQWLHQATEPGVESKNL